jgi:hypothetical protein
VAIEANVGGCWVARQTDKDTPAVTAIKRLRQTGGGMNPARTDGSENPIDGNRFANPTDFVETIIGQGNPTAQMGPGDGAYLCYLMAGQESVGAAVAGVYPHTIAFTQAAQSFWVTFWKRVGVSPVLRQQFNASRITSLRIEGSSANKVVKITPTFTSLDAGKTFDTDPVKAVDTDKPFLYTEAEGTFNINGTIIRGHSSFAAVIGDALAPWYGDSVRPHDLTTGQGAVAVENITLLVDTAGFALYNTIIYGTATPSAGTAPVSTIGTGSYTFTLTRGAGATLRSFQVTLPDVHWTPDMAIEGNPDGGAVEITLGAEARGTTPLTVVANNTDAAYA